jgi:hypothetical protein
MQLTRILGAVLLLVMVQVHSARADRLSDEQVSRKLFGEIFTPISDLASSVSATGIAIRGLPDEDGPERTFFDAVGNRFLADGFEVWLLQTGESAPDGVLELSLQLSAAEIDYPRQTRHLLGLGRARVLRRVSLGAHMRLTDPGQGRVLYNAEPLRVEQDWMMFTDANASAAVRPDWMGATTIPEMESRSPWWQRAAVVGIVGAVAMLYFGGAT